MSVRFSSDATSRAKCEVAQSYIHILMYFKIDSEEELDEVLQFRAFSFACSFVRCLFVYLFALFVRLFVCCLVLVINIILLLLSFLLFLILLFVLFVINSSIRYLHFYFSKCVICIILTINIIVVLNLPC
jgi:hypothetical protein